jgi:hypothetical protein
MSKRKVDHSVSGGLPAAVWAKALDLLYFDEVLQCAAWSIPFFFAKFHPK